MGLTDRKEVAEEVREAIKGEGTAKAHVDGKCTVVRVVGPDLRMQKDLEKV